MKQKNKQPKLRFPQFDGDWEEVTFNAAYQFKKTNSFSRAMLNSHHGVVKNIHYGDIHTKFSALLDISKEKLPFVKTSIDLSKIGADNYCQNQDLAIADASENYDDIGKATEICNIGNTKVLSGLHTFLARPNKKLIASGFGGIFMQSESIRYQIKIEAQGTKVLGISTKRLGSIQLHLPSLAEQEKIADFFSTLDAYLGQKKQRLALLQEYKRGMMQQLFSGQKRFQPDAGGEFPAWEWVAAKNIFKNHSNKNHNGELPIVAVTQDQGVVLRDSLEKTIHTSQASVQSYKIVEPGDFVISLRSFQGGLEHSDVKGICSPAYTILKPKVAIDSNFFKHYFKKERFIRRLSSAVIGIRDGKQISYSAFSAIKIPLPSIAEQKKIAEFLEAIDDRIKLVEQSVAQLESWKKGLLQELLV
ncbi:restriction endonuclease subunit S [Saprospira grandis]|uniref:restriction endonuclease subunit S n=1 Tax=Saprospira grandis TaxID=1008 RepID=UPI0022DD69EF|nr:restriction endonuclease subunit S [Saprospira grandis]WBM74821.1 restriction endonuclease subunit S [Saprospira grandis]